MLERGPCDDMTIRLSRLARRDLDEIRRYTVETWGRDQWLKYYEGMVQTFAGIAADSDGGRDRSLFAAGLLSVNYGRHVIFFARLAAAGDEPVIIHFAHRRRNIPALTNYEEVSGGSTGRRLLGRKWVLEEVLKFSSQAWPC